VNPNEGYPLLWLAVTAIVAAIVVIVALRLDERWDDEQREADIARILQHRYSDSSRPSVFPDFVPEEWLR
jgi:hypothetical protein